MYDKKALGFLKIVSFPKGQEPFLREENGSSTSYRGWDLHRMGRESPRFVEIPRLNAPATLPYERLG